jgi:hypothetical protein
VPDPRRGLLLELMPSLKKRKLQAIANPHRTRADDLQFPHSTVFPMVFPREEFLVRFAIDRAIEQFPAFAVTSASKHCGFPSAL